VSRPIPRPRDAYRWIITIATRWADNDAYGHVNNTVYYEWFDTAVNQWLVEAGLLDIEHGDPIGLVVETGCSYFAPLAFPGDIEVGIAIQRLGSSSVTYRIGIFAVGATHPAAQGHFTHVYVGRDDRRPTALPEEWRTRLETLV
jgi:acyl-CoA thioester hydrolase